MPIAARRILIIKPSSLGDIVHALPVLAGLREAAPEARIAWLVNDNLASLLEGHPLLDEVIRFERRRYGRMWRSPRAFAAFWRFVADLRAKRFDLAIDLQGLIRSGLMSRLSGARRRVGFSDAREGASLFYTQRVKCPASAEHAVERNIAVVRALGIDILTPAFPLGVRPEESRAARELLLRASGRDVRRFTAVLPGARWESKRWPSDKLGALIDRMHAEGHPQCVLLGAPDEQAVAASVAASCRSGVIDITGWTDLRQLTALLELADSVICHDSGPMHIAAALNKPTTAIFGPTNPARTGPFSEAARVASHAVECAPCYRRVCPQGHHRCMRDLEVDAVFQQVLALRTLTAERSAPSSETPRMKRNTCAG